MATHMYEEVYPKYLIVEMGGGVGGGGVGGTLPICTGEQPMSP